MGVLQQAVFIAVIIAAYSSTTFMGPMWQLGSHRLASEPNCSWVLLRQLLLQLSSKLLAVAHLAHAACVSTSPQLLVERLLRS
jgi:hypothetical protein